MRPGGVIAAAIASAASAPTSATSFVVFIQPSSQPASSSMSEFSGASYCRWYVAWSPTTLTTGVKARRALCRPARPLPRPGPEVEQRRRRAACHATEPVGGAGDDALVQSQHGAHLGHLVERCDEVHLGRARIAEADVDAAVDQRPDQCLSAVHVELSLSVRRIPTT